MHRAILYLLVMLLVIPLSGCLESFDAEAEEHFWQGIDYIREGNDELAMDEFTKAIEIDPGYYYAYYNRARVYYESGDPESSIVEYSKAIELNPDNVYWTIERGLIYLELGEREKAILDLERSQELGIPPEYRQRVEEALDQLGQ